MVAWGYHGMRTENSDAGSERGATTVTVANDLFDHLQPWPASIGDGWDGSAAFLVVSDAREEAAAALHAAGQRFMLVDEHGAELEPWQATDAYTPSYVSDVYLTDRGPALWVDTKGDLPRAQAEAMVRILVEELERRHVSGQVAAPRRSTRTSLRGGRHPSQSTRRSGRPHRAPGSSPEAGSSRPPPASRTRTSSTAHATATGYGSEPPPSGSPTRPSSWSPSSAANRARTASARSTASTCPSTTATGTRFPRSRSGRTERASADVASLPALPARVPVCCRV